LAPPPRSGAYYPSKKFDHATAQRQRRFKKILPPPRSGALEKIAPPLRSGVLEKIDPSAAQRRFRKNRPFRRAAAL